jgi:hypothetical protein
MSSTETQRPPPVFSLPAAITRLVVRLFAEYTGRGPTKARTVISDNGAPGSSPRERTSSLRQALLRCISTVDAFMRPEHFAEPKRFLPMRRLRRSRPRLPHRPSRANWGAGTRRETLTMSMRSDR